MVTQRKESKFVVALVNVLAGWSITSAALLCGSATVVQRLCAAVLYGSFMHVFMLASVTSDVKERSLRLRIICGGIVGFACAVFIIVTGYFGTSTKESLVVPSSDIASNEGQFPLAWVYLSSSLMWSWICFEYIALCYRMDYSFARQSEQVGAPKFRQLENTRPGTAPSPNKFPAIRVLASFQPTFDKPYYHASIAGVISTAVGLTCLITSVGRTGRIIGFKNFGVFFSVAGSSVVCLFVMALAYWRGEVRKVWGYGERWMDVPEGVPLISDEDESTVPEFEFCEKEEKVGVEEMPLVT